MLAPTPPRREPRPADVSKGPETPGQVVRVKVTLLEIVPPVWRRFRVPANLTLRRLHSVLQRVMGWKESPLHQFRVGDELFGMPSADSEKLKDSRWTTLQDLLSPKTRSFFYDYELGERWVHLVKIEGISDGDPSDQRPLCLGGKGTCPPAECGGPDAYMDILDARPDSADASLDPDAFDLEQINAELSALRF